MGQDLQAQMVLFAGCMGLGSIIGVLFDLCSSLGRTRRGRNLCDGCFCLLSAGIILLFLLMHTNGDLRAFQVLGGLLGFGGEQTCLRPVLRRGLGWLFPRLRWLAGKGRDGLLWLFSFPRGN